MSERVRERPRPPLSPKLLGGVLVAGAAVVGGLLLAKGGDAGPWGTFETPFAAESLWNARPVDPVLGSYVIPKTKYAPAVGEGAYSTAVFLASPADPPMAFDEVWAPDDEMRRPLTIPHWPRDVAPASGTDGHADIVDPEAGIIHSFWQLRREDGRWKATSYAWAPLAGSGWGDPAHYMRGARASGVPSAAGLIRRHEVEDGASLYPHALALTLANSALKPGYVFPATSEDGDAAEAYRGEIPMGSLLMLPSDFDVARLKDPRLRKVAETLKVYGARVVDRNHETRFTLFAENGSGLSVQRLAWDPGSDDELDLIADSLRVMAASAGFVDGNGRAFTPDRNLNLASLRGPWTRIEGERDGHFDSWRQALVFPQTAAPIVQSQFSENWVRPTPWARLEAGKSYRFSVAAEGGATLQLSLRDAAETVLYETGFLGDGGSAVFTLGAGQKPMLTARSGTGGPSSVRATLLGAAPE